MSREIRLGWPSGDTLTFVVRDPSNPTKAWYPDAGPAAWETFGTGSRTNADYDIAIVDKSGDWYVGDFPSGIAAGYYDIILLINGVVNTAWGIDWDGSARIESASDHAAVIKTAIWAKAMVDLPAGAPSATASVLTAINYIYEIIRNKIVTNKADGEISVYKDDSSTKLMEAPISGNAITFTREKFGAVD